VHAYARETELFNTTPLNEERKLEESSQIPANRRVSPSPRGDSVGTSTTTVTQTRTTVSGVPNKYGKIIYPDSHKLFVGNLFSECKDDLLQVFGEYGEVIHSSHLLN
jgi:hypothetical protein